MALLAASGGDTVKLFDVSVDSGDPCSLSYTPSPSHQVNSVKWNHTNLVVASAGDDKKITMHRTNGQSMGTMPISVSDSGDNIEEVISSISFSNKTSRYLCSGGSGQVVRIWDLQRKRCIKWLKGHTGSISGVMYNSKDEHLASISVNGDLIVHNLTSGAKAAELKDPFVQVLRAIDYSRVSRHLLATAGDDGSVHMWDTTGRSPKVSWLKQHSAPTVGLSFSPSNDKIIATVGLDKKLYTFESGTRRPTNCISYEAPFSSLAFRDDGWILAAGTSNGQVVFYDVRGKPQPFTVLRAYGHSEAVTSLCWQRSKPVPVNERTCTPEVALIGEAVENSVVMPDPLPSVALSSVSQATTSLGPPRRSSSVDPSFFASTTGESILNNSSLEETPQKSLLWPGERLSKLHAARSYNFKDDMEVFSPLVDCQTFTPPLDKLWNDRDGLKNNQTGEKRSSPMFHRKFSIPEAVNDINPIFDWKHSLDKQDDIHSPAPGLTSNASSRSEDPLSLTLPEAWGGERDKLTEKLSIHRQVGSSPSRISKLTSGSASTSTSMFSGLYDPSSSNPSTMNYSTSSSMTSANFRAKDISFGQETLPGVPGHVRFSSLPQNQESGGPSSLNVSRRFPSYAERISTSGSIGDGSSVGSPKTKKTGAETREELLNSMHSRSHTSMAIESGLPQVTNGASTLHQRTSQSDLQQGTSSFTLQLFQHTLDETLASFQKSIHEDVRNLHIEILRQFHMQETETSTAMNTILDNQAALMKEIQALRQENEQLRRLL